MAETKENETLNTVVGCIFLLIVGAAVLWAINWAYAKWVKSPAGTVSLTAYFVDQSEKPVSSDDKQGQLKIRGEAYQVGKPVTDGSAKITVSKQDSSFEQAVVVPVKDGKFEKKDDAFSYLRPDDQIHVRAEVSSPQLSDPAVQDVYLNTTRPAFSEGVEIILWALVCLIPLTFLVIFFIAFTGRRTPLKNRIAIILSYTIIGVFLAIPLMAPVLLLQAFPGVRRAMIGAPAGLVVTRIGNQQDGQNQWAVNIGGYSTRIPPANTEAAVTAPKTADKATPTPTPVPARGTTRTGTGAATAQPTATPTPNAAANPSPAANTSTATAAASATPTPQTSPSPVSAVAVVPQPNPATSPSPTGSGTTAASPTPPPVVSRETSDQDLVVKVEGGLVIPLYVIILSVIGGAINMTRKVPRFQREGEFSEFPSVTLPTLSDVITLKFMKSRSSQEGGSAPADVAAHGAELTLEAQAAAVAAGEQLAPGSAAAPKAKVPGATHAEGEKPLEDQAKEIDDQLDAMVREQAARNTIRKTSLIKIRQSVERMRTLYESKSDDESPLGFDTFEDWLGNRVGVRELLGGGWRVELLNQYMYLISAPFLAIVAYYMLDLLGLTKQPILVLISFSVGLISERILSWLLGMASGYLKNDPRAPAATR